MKQVLCILIALFFTKGVLAQNLNCPVFANNWTWTLKHEIGIENIQLELYGNPNFELPLLLWNESSVVRLFEAWISNLNSELSTLDISIPTNINVYIVEPYNEVGAVHWKNCQTSEETMILAVSKAEVLDPENLFAVLVHESVHHWLQFKGQNLPTWFEEGLAYFVQSELDSVPNDLILNQRANLSIPLNLDFDLSYPATIRDSSNGQSLLFIRQLVGVFGKNVLSEILFATSTEPPETFLRVLNQVLVQRGQSLRAVFRNVSIARVRPQNLGYYQPRNGTLTPRGQPWSVEVIAPGDIGTWSNDFEDLVLVLDKTLDLRVLTPSEFESFTGYVSSAQFIRIHYGDLD